MAKKAKNKKKSVQKQTKSISSQPKSGNDNKKLIFRGLVLVAVMVVLGLFFYDMLKEDKMKNVVVFETSKGVIKVELDFVNAPITSENFAKYVEDQHFDGLIFHRVIPNFMIQGGGFYRDGTQKSTRDPIKLESNNGLKNTRGTIAMARTMVEDSATSQFFINVVNNPSLNYAPGNPGYAVFGKVVEGMDVVDEIRFVETSNREGHGDWPVEDIIITKAYLE
ncbi:MAG: peptidylprolyl isomerase [Candidatus Woesearchaeota archaeon]